MKNLFITFLILYLTTGCQGQTRQTSSREPEAPSSKALIGGGCDGCELMYIGMPEVISATDTSAGWYEPGQKLMVTGTVYHLDGKTPAPGVIIYYWQTDHNGYYSPRQGLDPRVKRHGHIRGWVKTDAHGQYTLLTVRPAPYPGEAMPAHIHLSVKEPGLPNEYYTDEINFDDDPLLIPHFKKYPQENRGGSGVVRVLLQDNLQIAEHDIILGLNIPNYPEKTAVSSGLNIGEDQPSFMPFHAYGPDKGTQTCPVCQYGRFHGILYFVGNHPDWPEVKKWLSYLEQESRKREKYLKVYFVYGNALAYTRKARENELEQLGKELRIQNTALTFVPSFSDTASETHLNRINPEADNTFIIYKHRGIVDKYVNLEATAENFGLISKSLDRTRGEYFGLPEPEHR